MTGPTQSAVGGTSQTQTHKLEALTLDHARTLRNIGVMPAGVQIIDAVAEAIRDLDAALGQGVPSGVLYANVMPAGITHAIYVQVIEALKALGLVTDRGHLLRWVGPAKASDNQADGAR